MPTFTLLQLQGMVYDGLDENQGFFNPLQVTDALNECLYRLNILLGIMQDTIPVPGFTKPNQFLYNTPPGILIPMRAYCEGRELKKLELPELAQVSRSWTIDTNLQKGPISKWATIGLRQFAIWPSDATGGSFLEVQGIVAMTPLVFDDDVANIEDPWANLLVEFARARVLLKDSTATFGQASLIYQRWMAQVQEMTEWGGIRWPAYFWQRMLDPNQKVEKLIA